MIDELLVLRALTVMTVKYISCSEVTLVSKTLNKTIKMSSRLSLCLQVLQAQISSLLRGEADINATCTQTEEAISGEACVASLQAEQELGERLMELARLGLPCQPEENDQLDLVMETDGLRKSIHNLGTIVTTR